MKKAFDFSKAFVFSTSRGIRTHDPRIKSPLLYQLSYRGVLSILETLHNR